MLIFFSLKPNNKNSMFNIYIYKDSAANKFGLKHFKATDCYYLPAKEVFQYHVCYVVYIMAAGT